MSGAARQVRQVIRKRSMRMRGNAETGGSGPQRRSHFARYLLASWTWVFAAPALVALGQPQVLVAQTFDQASFVALEAIFENFSNGPCNQDPKGQTGCWITPGSNLAVLIPKLLSNTANGVVSAAPATSLQQTAAGPAIERRLQAVRESEEPKREAGLLRAIPASYTGDRVLADGDQLQLPPAGGATPEIVIQEAQGFSLFASAGATALNHHNNEFEDGYEAQLPTVTLGADY